MLANPASARLEDVREHARTETNSYSRIVASSAVIGMSTLASVAVGIVRAKAMAMLLGPAGFGLMGTFQAIADLARSIAEVGVNGSGVRQIAQAAASNDLEQVGRTVASLRRVAVVLGLLGAILLAALAAPVASFTFGSLEHADAIVLLSLAVFLRLVSDAQGALIQGLRRIGDLARATVLGAIVGTVLAILLVWKFRADGIVPALVAIAAASLACTWWYSRKVRLPAARLGRRELRDEAQALLRLGLAFMASGLLMAGAAFAGRIIVLDQIGLEAVGLYQAAWTIGGLYVGFVLQAMGTDFYPRLVGAIDDREACRRLVNEQAHASLLIAIPGVIATLALAPLVLTLFYSAAFSGAAETLRWLCLGMALRVVTWPMGYVIVAKGAQTIFFLTELAWAVFNVASTWILVKWVGLPGIGIAFLLSYVLHFLLVYPVVRRMIGFRWTRECSVAAFAMLLLCSALLLANQLLADAWSIAVGGLATAAATTWSARRLIVLVPAGRIPLLLRRALGVGNGGRAGQAQSGEPG